MHAVHSAPYIAFIDYEKAFDSVETSAVMQALRNQGVDEHCVRILDIYNGSTATIILHNQSSKIPIRKGVREADNVSNIIPRMLTRITVFRTLDWEQVGVRVDGEYLSNLKFSDDVTLLSNSRDELQSMFTALDKQSRIAGLKINVQKRSSLNTSIIKLNSFLIDNSNK